jgi:hypothetical protein
MHLSKLLVLFANIAAAEPAWYNQKLEGWYYFQEEGADRGLKGLAPEEAHDILEEEKQKTQEALSLAILSPTKDNVENYLSLSKRWSAQSALFADEWGKVLEEKPSNELGSTNFLLFCFKGEDPASMGASHAAKAYAKKTGLTLKAVSLDGCGVKGIEDFSVDSGIVKNLKIEEVPSLYAVDPFKNTITQLGIWDE